MAFPRWMLGVIAVTVGWAAQAASAPISEGRFTLAPEQIQPGQVVDLTGQWQYKPGYLLSPDERPELTTTTQGFVPVPVPQMLNRIRWWLDDSEDFKHDEEKRLQRLGFDTGRAEDGWYRLEIETPALPPAHRLFVEFDGVAMRCEVFCNGRSLGKHNGMFSRFQFDLSPHLQPGRNVLAVYVSMEKISQSQLAMGQAVSVNLTASKVKTMSKGMFGPLVPDQDNRSYDLHGIWQPVRLVVRRAAMIEDVWFAPSLDGGKLCVESRALGQPCKAVVKARWSDVRSGEQFASAASHTVEQGADPTSLTLELSKLSPKLWTPAEPNLYVMDVSLESRDGKLLDCRRQKVGFRTFQTSGSQFLLNGKPYWLRGSNHLPYGKNPWSPELARRLVQLMHDNNQRVTRTHCTPWNEAWLEAADEIGLGLSLEGIRPWAFAGKIGATPPELFQHWLMENEDVVRRCRNHPSVLLWDIGNEMMLRESDNAEKWQQLSQVIQQTRSLDPSRPVIAYSSYRRDSKLYEKLLKPNGFDDGDVDTIHSYNGWYSSSAFVDADARRGKRAGQQSRPVFGQEMSTGYPDLDTGLPVLRYTRDMLTPQAWVGMHAYPGHDPAIFLEHHRAVTKRWAERLRMGREGESAGMMMFAAECWFSHSYDSGRTTPYPVVEAMRYAWSPVGLALETGRHRFFSGEEVKTSVQVANDDEQNRDFEQLELLAEFVEVPSGHVAAASRVGVLKSLPYYAVRAIPVTLHAPEIREERAKLELVLRLMGQGKEISRTVEPIELFRHPTARTSPIAESIVVLGRAPGMVSFMKEEKLFGVCQASMQVQADLSPRVVLIGEQEQSEDPVTSATPWVQAVSRGATAIVLAPGEGLRALCADVLECKTVTGEYADPVLGQSELAEGLAAMDIKWWARRGDDRLFVASAAHRLRSSGCARELVRFVPEHGYIAPEKVPGLQMAALFEVRLGRGRIWGCDLDLEECVPVDPAARLFATNLLRAAANPDSTSALPAVPAHEELIKALPGGTAGPH